MKRTTVFILALATGLLMSYNAISKNYDRKSLITYEQFVEKVSALQIPGFTTRPQFEADDDEYNAYFIQGGESFVITLEARHYEPVWMDAPYKLDGKDAEFASLPMMAVLSIDLPETYSKLNIGSTKIRDKATLERIVRETGFLQMVPQSTNWPSLVPADYRLKGLLLKATQGEDYDAGFSYQVRATMVMNPQLKESLVQMAARYSDEGDFLRFPNGIILNYPFSEIESIDEMYSDNDEIEFLYYIP